MNIDPKEPDAKDEPRTPDPDPVERLLPAVTTWPGEAADVWKRALEQSRRPRVIPGWRRWALPLAVAGAAAAVLFVIAIPSFRLRQPVTGHRESRGEEKTALDRRAAQFDAAPSREAPEALARGGRGVLSTPSAGDSEDDLRNSGYAALRQLGYVGDSDPADGDGVEKAFNRPAVTAHGGMVQVPAPLEPVTRQVVQRIAIDLVVEDVQQTFQKVQLLVSEAHGEYVGQSNLSGSDDKSRASLTLRVTPGRLSGVMNELRALGKVSSETAAAEDVTQQVVDVESRLRNERQVETELLKLLAARPNSRLEEILTLRQHIAAVRERIETLVGRRESLAKLTGLATVLVTLSPPNAPPESQPWIGTFFYDALNRAVGDGARDLANTLAGFVAILIGGAPWWCLLAAGIWWVRRVTLSDRVARGA